MPTTSCQHAPPAPQSSLRDGVTGSASRLRSPWDRVCLTVLLSLAIACERDAVEPSPVPNKTAAKPTVATGTGPAELKLVELLETAVVSSPLATASPTDRGRIRGRSLLALDFERASESQLGWKRGGRGRIVKRGDGKGRALRVDGGRGQPLALLVAVTPQRFVRIERWRQGPPTAPRMVVVETTVQPRHRGLNHPADLSRALSRHTMAGSHVNLAVLVRQHRLPPAPSSTGWQRGSLDLFTSADTRSLLLLLQPDSGGQEHTGPALFDDIAVTALEPSGQERLALVRQRYDLAPGTLGVRAFAQFLPRTTAGGGDEHESNFEYRHALLTPTPTAITWTLTVPPEARLSFGLAALPESAAGPLPLCRLRVNGTVLWQRQLDASHRRTWQAHTVSLAEHGGQQVRLELSTVQNGSEGPGATGKREQSGATIAVWSNPTLWRPRRPTDPANIYLVAVDTLRADRLSTYGHSGSTPTSPHLDNLSRDAVLFDNVIAQSNWTPESFASLFTSTYSGQHGVTERLTKLTRNDLAHLLRTGGYLTQGIAYKLLLYDMGFERGFDAFFNVPRFHLNKGYDVHAGVNWARAAPWLRGHTERQVFLFYHLNDPHQPFNHRGESLPRFTDVAAMERRGLELPILIRNHAVSHGAASVKCKDCARKNRFEPWFKELASSLYDGSVAYTDEHVGLFVGALKELGLYDDALIVFLSDHGEGLADHDDYIGHGFQHMYDEQIRVPLLIKPPARARIDTPQRIDAQVRLVDVAPTLLDLVGLAVPRSAEGSSLVPAMRGEPLSPRPAVSENVEARTVAVRADGFKYVLRYGSNPPRERFYDLRVDAAEKTNRSADPTLGERLGAARDHSLRHLLRTHAGCFLALACAGKGPHAAVTLGLSDPSAKVLPLAGRLQRRQASQAWSLQPTAHGRLCAAVKIAAPERATAHVVAGPKRHRLPSLGRWSPHADAQRVALGAGLEARLLCNAARTPESRQGLRGAELEALRALGYVDE